MTIVPTNDLLIVQQLPDEEPETSWGFLLPPTEEHLNTPLRGKVIFAGNGRRPKMSGAGKDVVACLQTLVDALNGVSDDQWLGSGLTLDLIVNAENVLKRQSEAPDVIPMSLQVGDIIIFSRNGHQSFRVDGQDVLVMQEASVMGVIGSEEAVTN